MTHFVVARIKYLKCIWLQCILKWRRLETLHFHYFMCYFTSIGKKSTRCKCALKCVCVCRRLCHKSQTTIIRSNNLWFAINSTEMHRFFFFITFQSGKCDYSICASKNWSIWFSDVSSTISQPSCIHLWWHDGIFPLLYSFPFSALEINNSSNANFRAFSRKLICSSKIYDNFTAIFFGLFFAAVCAAPFQSLMGEHFECVKIGWNSVWNCRYSRLAAC